MGISDAFSNLGDVAKWLVPCGAVSVGRWLGVP